MDRCLALGLCLAAALASPPSAVALAPTPAGDTLHVVVSDTAGRPLEGVTVTIAELDRARSTDAAGVATFPDIPASRYTVVVRRPGYAPLVRQVSVTGSLTLTLTLEPTALRLEPVTVTATRLAIDPLASPLPTEALAGERLRQEETVSLAQTLDGMAGVRTLATGQQVGKPIIRGLTGPRVLTLDDGLRLEDYSWSDEDGPSVEPLLARRIEVIRGPASVLYGSDAIGGVINVIPDELPDARGREGFVRGEAELYGGTNNGEIGGPIRLEGASGRFGWRAVAVGRTAGDFHTPAGNDSTPTGKLFDTGYHSINGELALGLHGANAGGAIRYEHYGGHFGLLDGPPVPEDDSLGPLRKLSDDRIQGTTNWLLGPTLRLETRSQWQRHSLVEVVDQSRVGNEEPTFDLLLNTVTTDLLLHHALREWLTGTVGVSGLYQSNESEGRFPLVPGARTTAGAMFAFEQATFGRWSVLVGVRGDVRRISADANTTLQLAAQRRTLSAFSGDLGAVFRPIEGLAISGNVGRAFRAPTLFELFTNGPHLGEDRFEVGLPNARPELSLNADLSVRWQVGRFSGQVAGYRNQIDNYLYVQPTDSQVTVPLEEGDTATLPLYRFAQTARAVLWGMDVAAEVEALPFVTLRGRLDFVRGTNDQAGEPLPLIPPARGDLEAELHTVAPFAPGRERGWGRAFVSVGTQLVARQDRLGPFDTPTGGYALLNLGAGLERRLFGRSVTFDLRVRNAANRRYTDFLSRYKLFAYGQGRNVIFRATMRF
jgi:outer membrane receptor protein involved in Fe transport